MFDEYYHLISEGIGIKDNKNEKIIEFLKDKEELLDLLMER